MRFLVGLQGYLIFEDNLMEDDSEGYLMKML